MRFAPRTEETTTLSYRHITAEEKIERLDIATTTTPRWQPRPQAPRLHELNKVSRSLRAFLKLNFFFFLGTPSGYQYHAIGAPRRCARRGFNVPTGC